MDKITEGVGKKIVEALKQQSDIEIQNVVENPAEENDFEMLNNDIVEESPIIEDQTIYQAPPVMTFSQPVKENYASELDNFEIPSNVAVLKNLINQLPAGVSRQTGAQIIKQTMEALGISMKSVLQEAQQVQENLNNSAKDCQASIIEYKKQIGLLERQSQKYQRQSSALNDIISLFIQTNL